MRSYKNRRGGRRGRNDGSLWLSFSDLMSSLLLIILLVLFYVMYQYFDMTEISMAKIARQQYDLEEANASLAQQQDRLTEQETKLTAQEMEIIRQKQQLEIAEAGLTDAQELLDSQRAELESAQSQLDAQRAELESAQNELESAQAELKSAQTELQTAQAQLATHEQALESAKSLVEEKEHEVETQREQLDELSVRLDTQQSQINEQQDLLDTQQRQIEQLVGLKTRIISSLSTALRGANISATVDPTDGSIALESDLLFATGQYQLTERGKAWIDDFLPVYLDVLFSEEYRPYVAEIIIEGHTDSVGTYLKNLSLSQQRANAVATYVLSDDYDSITDEQREYLRQVATANGRSFSDPILVDGVEDKDASRRVVFKFRLTDENMIEQLKAILERED